MQCRECHAELPQGARRCPQCGRPVLHEKIWNNKRLRALLIGITIVLIAVGAGFAVVASQDAAVNSRVKDAICNFQFDTAETLRGDVKLFPAGTIACARRSSEPAGSIRPGSTRRRSCISTTCARPTPTQALRPTAACSTP